MNIQGKLVNGKVIGGIEWLKTILADGAERQGYTWNVVGGCFHECQWEMPNGDLADCYAKTVALRLAQASYPKGFEHHYWHPDRLGEPLAVKEPARIFIDSMSDLMGRWVTSDQIDRVLDACEKAHWHTFLLLTKNTPRLPNCNFPGNVHVGFSSSPDFMWGKRLSQGQQEAFLKRGFESLDNTRAAVKWVSFEPLSWDVADIVATYPKVLNWAVIGAASKGKTYYQPERRHVERLLEVLDSQGVPVFFKGNLKWEPWREEYPEAQR